MHYRTIDLQRDDTAAFVTLNDPPSRNAITVEMIEEFNAALDDMSGWARVMILTGQGAGFCSGANLSGGLIDHRKAPTASVLESHLNPLMRRLRDLPFPWISAVNGPAAGFGCSLALAADIIVCSESAFFLQAFAHIGLVPDGGSSWLLMRSLTRARAMEMMLLAQRVPASKALEWGMVNRVVPDRELAAVARDLATSLSSGPTKSLAMIRRLAWSAADASFDEALALECDWQRLARATKDHREGVAAFLGKRAPQFTGE